ncbi:MAG: hypothetical protein ACMG6S_32950 [Byssovorax sp.]
MIAAMNIPEVNDPHGLAVRPDVLCTAVSARLEDVTPTEATALLRAAAAALQARAAGLHPGAELSGRRLDLGRHSGEKAAKSASGDAQLDGVLLVPLDPAADFWARADLVARLTEALRALTLELAKSKSPVRLGFRPPVARVRDALPHRAELTARFRAQLRALTEGSSERAGSGGWEIPDEIVQQAVSLDEVRLLLVAARRSGSSREG